VTIDAILPHIRKHRIQVAQRTFHTLVHSPQRIFRLVVIEFRACLDRAPRCGGMAIFARDGELRAMRTASRCFTSSRGG
jgi:hypothetical protein